MLTKVRHLALFFVLLIGVLSNAFASTAVHDASKISIEKSAIGIDVIKAWEAMIPDELLRNDVS